MQRNFVVQKNDIIEILINDIGANGEGIGKYNGYTLFVKDALIGDMAKIKVIKTKKAFGYGRLIEIMKPSPHRVEPRCNVAAKCGGCQLQHLDYQEQLKYKQNKVKNCLVRIGGFNEDFIDTVMEPIVGMDEPYYYRNKAQYPIGRNNEGEIVAGFYAGRTHSIVDTSHCYIQADINERILQVVKEFLKEFNISVYDENNHTGLVRHILTRVGYVTNEIMVCLIMNGQELPYKEIFIERLRLIEGMSSICININRDKTNVILGKDVMTLWGNAYITDYIGDIKYQISPLSFFQVNPIQTKILYDLVLEYADLNGNEVVWDLYCGIGTISLFLAQKAKKVYGIEIVPQAIEDAIQNAKINDIGNVEFLTGAAEDRMPDLVKTKGESVIADVVVVDPPRKGCDEVLLDTIVNSRAKKIVYVSCDPGTLGRDLGYLSERGYEITRVRAVDQFGHSVHVETVVLMQLVDEKGK